MEPISIRTAGQALAPRHRIYTPEVPLEQIKRDFAEQYPNIENLQRGDFAPELDQETAKYHSITRNIGSNPSARSKLKCSAPFRLEILASLCPSFPLGH